MTTSTLTKTAKQILEDYAELLTATIESLDLNKDYDKARETYQELLLVKAALEEMG